MAADWLNFTYDSRDYNDRHIVRSVPAKAYARFRRIMPIPAAQLSA